jgi:hypothetical protein
MEQPQTDHPNSIKASASSVWGVPLTVYACENCGNSFLYRPAQHNQLCPVCHTSRLGSSAGSGVAAVSPPELVIPFRVNDNTIVSQIQKFSSDIPFAPPDLNPQNLQARLTPIFIPEWLVDAEIEARWYAEAGFNYQVVSHQESFSENRGGWTTKELQENRVRWEPRAGTLARIYHNIHAAAIEEEKSFIKALGMYPVDQALPYERRYMPDTMFVRLPNRDHRDAWSTAETQLMKTASDECRQACEADHLRQFRWSPEYKNQNWTLLLRPVYTTYYLDDDGKPQSVLFNGHSGRISGQRRASMKRAQALALNLIILAAIIFMFGLLTGAATVLFPPIMALAGLLLVASIFIGLGALYPLLTVWRFNRN